MSQISCQGSQETTQKNQSVVTSNNNYEDYDDNGDSEEIHTSSFKTALVKGFILSSWFLK